MATAHLSLLLFNEVVLLAKDLGTIYVCSGWGERKRTHNQNRTVSTTFFHVECCLAPNYLESICSQKNCRNVQKIKKKKNTSIGVVLQIQPEGREPAQGLQRGCKRKARRNEQRLPGGIQKAVLGRRQALGSHSVLQQTRVHSRHGQAALGDSPTTGLLSGPGCLVGLWPPLAHRRAADHTTRLSRVEWDPDEGARGRVQEERRGGGGDNPVRDTDGCSWSHTGAATCLPTRWPPGLAQEAQRQSQLLCLGTTCSPDVPGSGHLPALGGRAQGQQRQHTRGS